MATEQQRVNITFSANVDQARQAMKQLQTDLQNLTTATLQNNSGQRLTNDLIKASQVAQQLKINLNSAFNVNTGSLDLVKFIGSMEKAGLSAEKYRSALQSLGPAGDHAFAQVSQSIAQAEMPLTRLNSKMAGFATSLKNTVKWQLSSSLLHGFISSINSAFSYARNLNSSLNDIRIVTGQSAEEMAKFAQMANQSAKALSTSTKTYADAALIFYQQGLGDAEVKERTDAVIKMANVTKDSASQVSSYMTAIWNNFDNGSKSLEHYADVITALGAATASSSAEIAAGLEKFASIGKTIGLSYDYATSALATIVSNTRQSAEVVGNGLRTIFSRLQGLSLGETLEDGVNLNKYSKALQSVGISILDTSGQMKSMDTILDSLAAKWDKLSAAQQTALAQTVGGVRQYTTLISLMNNWNDMEVNLNTAAGSSGTLSNQAEIYAESWEAAKNRVRAASEDIYTSLLDDKFFINLNNGIAGFLNSLNKVIDGMGGLKGLILTVTPLLGNLFRGQITAGISNMVTSLTALTPWGRQKLAGQQSAFAKEVEQMHTDTDTSGGYAMAKEYKQMANLQKTYISAQKNMTDADKSLAQSLMQQQDALSKKVQMSGQAADNAEREARAVATAANDIMATTVKNGMASTIQRSIGELSSAATAQGFQSSAIKHLNTLNIDTSNIQAAKATLQDFLTLLQEGGKRVPFSPEFQAAFAELQKLLSQDKIEAQELEKALQKLKTAGTGTGLVDKATKNFEDAANKGKVKRKTITNVKKETIKTGTDLGAKEFDLALQSANSTKYYNQVVAAMRKAAEAQLTFASGTTAVVTGLTALSAAITAVRNLSTTWNDESASFGEKMLTSITSLLPSLSMIAVTMMGQNGMLLQQIGLTAALKLGWISTAAAEKLAGVVGTEAGLTTMAAWAPLAAVVLAAMAVIVTVVKIVEAATEAYDNWYNAQLKMAQELSAAAKALQEMYDTAKQSYEDMIATMSKYDSALASLETLTEGTKEYTQALREANEAGLSLINSHSDVITAEDYFWENGILKINESALNRLKDSEHKELNQLYGASILANQRAQTQNGYSRAEQLVRGDDDSVTADIVKGGGTFAGAAYGASAGWKIGAAAGSAFTPIGTLIGGIAGLIIGGIGGGIGGHFLAESAANAAIETDNKAQLSSFKKLVEAYKEVGEQALTTAKLEELGFDTANKAWIESIKSCVRETVNSSEGLIAAARAAAEVILETNEEYSRSSSESKDAIGGVTSRALTAYEETYTADYLTQLGGKKTRGAAFDEYAAKILASSLGYTQVAVIDYGDGTSKKPITYSYVDANGAAHKDGSVTHQTVASSLGGIKASQQMTGVSEEVIPIMNMLMNSSDPMLRAVAMILGEDTSGMTYEEFSAINKHTQNGTATWNFGGLLNQAFGKGFDYGYLGFPGGIYDVNKHAMEIIRTDNTAWGPYVGQEWFNKFDPSLLTLGATKGLGKTISRINAGPGGQAASTTFVDTILDMLTKVSSEDQSAVLSELLAIDWSSWDALEKANAVITKYGGSLNLASDEMILFRDTMREATGSIPDFSNVLTNIKNVSKVLNSLDFGSIVSPEDYKTLIDYNQAWKEFFVLQADGSYKFIGDSKEMMQQLRDRSETYNQMMTTYSNAAKQEDIMLFGWNKTDDLFDENGITDKGKSTKEKFDKLYVDHPEFKELLTLLGYDSQDDIDLAFSSQEGVNALFSSIYKALDPANIASLGTEFEVMIASLAPTIKELQALFDEGIISEDTYSNALISMASQYEYCAEAIKTYQESLKGTNVEQQEAARLALENTVAVEEEAAAYESMYQNAIKGKTNMSAEDLLNLKKQDSELYDQFLTSSDEEWYTLSYEAYSKWLDERIASYPKDSAAYKALIMEKKQLDDEYYDNISDKNKEVYDSIINGWKEQNSKISESIDALSIFDEGKTYGEQSFEAIEKLRQSLLSTGKTAEEVDQILKNLGKDDELTDKETIWAAAQEEVRLLLDRAMNNQDAQAATSGLQLEITGIKNSAKFAQETPEGYSVTTSDAELNTVVTGGEFEPGATPVLEVQNGQLVVRTGEKTVPFSTWVTNNTNSSNFTTAIGIDGNGNLYLKVTDDTGAEFTASINDEGAVFSKGKLVQLADGSWGVEWSDELGRTYTAKINDTGALFNNGKLVQLADGSWGVQWSDALGRTYTAKIDDTAALFNNGKLIQLADGSWGVQWSNELGRTYTAKVDDAAALFSKGKLIQLADGSWGIQWSDELGRTYTAKVDDAGAIFSKGKLVQLADGSWGIQWSNELGRTYTATLGSAGSFPVELTYDSSTKTWGVKFGTKTGETFTATLEASPGSNWATYLEPAEDGGFRLKLVNRDTGESISLGIDDKALAELASSTTASQYLIYEDGGFTVKTKSGSIEIAPILNLDGTGFHLENGQLVYGSGEVVGEQDEVIVFDEGDGSASVLDNEGKTLGTMANGGEALNGTMVGSGIKAIVKDGDGYYVLDGRANSKNGINLMDPGEILQYAGVEDAVQYDTLFGPGYNLIRDFRKENNGLSLTHYLARQDTTDIWSPWSDPTGRYALFGNWAFDNATPEGADEVAIPLLRSWGASKLYNHSGEHFSLEREAYPYESMYMADIAQLYAPIVGNMFDDIVQMDGYIEDQSDWLSDATNQLLTGWSLQQQGEEAEGYIDGLGSGVFSEDTIKSLLGEDDGNGNWTMDPAYEAYFDGILGELQSDPEYREEFLFSLMTMLKDPQIPLEAKAQGIFVARGLLLACSDELANNDPIIVALQQLLADMSDTLGIASPSKKTMEMGHWLAKGLEEGANQEDIDLSPLAERALASIQSSLTKGLKNGHFSDLITKAFDIPTYDDLTTIREDFIKKELEGTGVTFQDGKFYKDGKEITEKSNPAAWKETQDILSQSTADYMQLSSGKYILRTDAEKLLSASGVQIVQLKSGSFQLQDSKGNPLEDTLFTNYETAFGSAIEGIYTEKAMTAYFSRTSDPDFINYLNDENLTAIQRGFIGTIMEDALKEATKDTGKQYANWDELVNAVGFDAAMGYIEKSYQSHNAQFLNDTSLIWSQINDIMVNAVSQQIKIEDKAAKKVVDIWTKAFKAILAAREAMIKGESFASELNEDAMKSLISQYAVMGWTPEQIINEFFKTSGQQLPQFTMSYNDPSQRSFLDKHLSYDASGFVTSTALTRDASGKLRTKDHAGYASFEAGVRADLRDSITDGMGVFKFDEILSSEAVKTAAMSGDIEKAREAAKLINPSLTNDQIDLILAGAMSKDKDGKDVWLSQIDIDAAVDKYIKQHYPDGLDEAYQTAVEGRIYSDLNYRNTLVKSAQSSGETYINKQQASFDVVSKAREAMLKGEDLKYALTAEEQKQLLEITKKSDLTAVSLGDLDNASTTLTNTMITCAKQLGIAMGMIERGEATGFSIDPTTGAVTVTNAVVNQDEVDKFLTSKQITRDKAGNYYRNGQIITADSNPDLWKEIQNVIQNNTTTTSVPLSGAPSNNTGDVLDNAGAGNDDAVRLQYAQEAGYGDLQEQDDYIDYLEQETHDAKLHTSQEELEEDANAIMEIEQAWKDLYETQASNIKILKEGRKGTSEYIQALGGLTKTVKKVFGGSDKVTEKFVEKHLKDIEKMADGDEKALERVEDALLKEILGTTYDIKIDIDKDGNVDKALGDIIDDFNELEVTLDGVTQKLGDVQEGAVITPDVDTSGAIGALVDLVNAGGETAAATTEALSAIGYEPVISYEEVSIDQLADGQGNVNVPIVEVVGGIPQVTGWTTEPITAEMTSKGTISIPKIGSGGAAQVGQTGAAQVGGFRKTGAGTSSTGDKRGGGGGGGARRRYLSKAKPEDHKERYHEINNAIDDVSDALERLNKQQDRAWGADRLKSMQAESAELKKQADLIHDKIAEAEAYLDTDLDAAIEAGWTFDEDGNVSNYEDHWDDLLEEYNNAIEEYNNMSAAEQEALDKQYEEANDKYWADYQADMAKATTEEEKAAVREKYKQWINPETETAFGSYEEYLKYTMLDAPTEALEQYEETMELLEDLGLEMADVLNAWYDNILEQIQYKLDLALELTENELNIIDYKLKSIEDNAYRAGEALGLMTQKMDASKSNFNAYYTALDDLLKANNADWSADKLLSGEITAEDLADAGLQSGDIDIIKTVMEGLRESTAAMTEQMVEGYETMTDSFESFNEELQRYISTIEHAQNVTSTYRNILDLTGRSMSGFTATMLKELNTLVVEQAQHKLTSNKTTLDTVKKEFETAQAAYKKAQEDFAAGKIDQAALDAAKKAYESAQDNLDEAEENFLASWEETLQAAADAFESNIEEITRTIGEALSGGLAGGLAELEDQFSKMSEQNDLYVDDYEKIYQLTKLTRDLDSKIDNTTNVRAQREMLKLQKEINGLLESDKKLSQYDIEYLQKKADLKMAEIAMQDAQNAKSQVTMRRDSEGNYNYVYTADENAVEKAEQEYADKLYEMQVANDEYITTLQNNMSALSSQMLNEIASIDRTVYDTEEKYQAEVERITSHYSTMMENYNSEMKKVLDNNTILYNEDWTEFNKFTGYKISAAENYVTKWNQTMLSQVTGFDTQEDYYANFNKTLFGDNPESPSSDSLIGQVLAAYRTMTQQIAAANQAAGLETGTLADLVIGNIDAATDEAEQAAQDITTQAGIITTAIQGIGTAISTMAANYAQDFKTMSDATDVLNRRLSDFLTMAGSSQEFSIDAGVLSQIRARLDAEGFDTGGYTGAWGSEGKLAFLHQKELVLNAEDTANMLASVGILRQIANVIDLNALTSAGGFISLMSSEVRDNKETLQQEVHIEAHFPNATDKNQIEDAFKDIVNLAAQYANRSSF